MTYEKDIESLLKQPSLYPDLPRKSEDRRKDDLVQWLEKYGEVNRSYNLYGLDVVDFRNPDDFLDNGVFKSQRYKANSSFYPNGSRFAYDYSIVFRDKKAVRCLFCPSASVGRDADDLCVSGEWAIAGMRVRWRADVHRGVRSAS